MAVFITQHILSYMGEASSRPTRLCPVLSHITVATVIRMESALVKCLVQLYCQTQSAMSEIVENSSRNVEYVEAKLFIWLRSAFCSQSYYL